MTEGFDKEFDVKLYIEKLEDAKKVAKDQTVKGTKLSIDNIVSIATTMYISAKQNMRNKRY